MREELCCADISRYSIGITPACAGRTRLLPVVCLALKDHPRVCGKNQKIVAPMGAFLGSPPRVREEPVIVELINDEVRITPACAGRTYHF